jgi:photosystem II stability/assembly factor-like uncharacterized protein
MKKLLLICFGILVLTLPPAAAWGQEKEKEQKEESKFSSGTFSALSFRSIGPAFMSGRIGDAVIDPTDMSTWYVAVCSGNVWKTVNAGTTWTPIFDRYGSYSIGCLALDPNNPLIVWVGTGENNSQRSVGFGDGVYKSLDGGKGFENVGLKDSQHIGKIIIDPRDSSVVYVAAQGPLWNPGGDRGLYKSTDGGKTWNPVLSISENTGVTDVVYDPRNPDVLYAAAYQRRRHVWTLLNGGPESAVYKSTDAGANWKKLTKGLPGGDVGRIGLAISPQNPDVVYAIVEAAGEAGGFFRSEDAGENWKKMSDYVSASPQYYQEIYCDPFQFDKLYSLSTVTMVTEDGGKTFNRLSNEWRHVDDHAIAFFPGDPEHYLIGGDGGLYETWDAGKTWDFKANLPVTQFYKVAVDNDFPFYNIYGGTQDNATQGGPSRTNNTHGIRNSNWIVTVFGDGFQTRVDPEDPNIVYSEYQHGGLVRYDKRSGERVDIQPQPEPGEDGSRWNWDAPLIISPHSHTRLYFGSQRLYRSDDRGDSWTPVSPDLTQQIDRNKLEIMGRIWSVDAVSKNRSTSFYGNLVALTESPLVEGLIYVGTDDGVVQVTEDGGANWRKIEKFPGVPELTYVSDLFASQHDPDTVFAAFNNHKMGDFKPYLLKSTDRGRTWTSVAGDLPERHFVWSVVQDHEKPDLLFVGTEFGVFFTADGGKKWVQLKGGIPTIAVRDLEIQRRENDLVCASFGRGFYILDDYTPLRHVTPELLEQEYAMFPVKKTWMYVEAAPLAGGEKAFQGHSFFTAPNPPFGAVFTYYLKESLKTRKEKRQEEEKKIQKEGGDTLYPPWDDLKLEDREEKPSIVFTITDESGNVVDRITGPISAGFHRISWDLTYPSSRPKGAPSRGGDSGPMVVPGKYTVSAVRYAGGEFTPLGEPVTFETVPLGLAGMPAQDYEEVLAFQKKTGELLRAVLGANAAAGEAADRLELLKKVIMDTPAADPSFMLRARELELRLLDIREEITGDPTRDRRSEPTPPSLMERVQRIVRGHWAATSGPTQTHKRQYELVADDFGAVLEKLRTLIEVDLKKLEDDLEAAGAPWTPGRGVPKWKR